MTAFLFPGQGSQRPGMGLDFFKDSPTARIVFDQANEVLGNDFVGQFLHADEARLSHTRMAQPALVTVEAAIVAHLSARGIHPTICAGHSLGEISALVAAGVCSLKDALNFTRERARLMSENVPEGGMAAVMGLEPEAIEAALPDGVQVANFNNPQQTIISGTKAGLEAADASLKAAGAKRVMALNVSGPFHSALMRPAAEAFAKFIDAVPFNAPTCTFLSSVTGQVESDPERIRALLSEQLYSPVRWIATMQCVAGLAPTQTLEVGPGNVLKGLAKRIEGAPEVACVGTLAEAEGVGELKSNN